MMGLLARIAGPKILLGVVVAAGLAIGWLWWSYSSAAADAAQSEANADRALQAAAANAEAARAARRNAEVIAATLEGRQQREQALRARLSRTHDQLKEARDAASQEVRDCLAVRLPDNYLDGLRAARGGYPDRNADPDPAAGAD